MKRIIIISLGIVFITALIALVTGLYPVAIIDWHVISYRTIAKAESAARNFANAEFQKSGMKPINFSLPQNAVVRRDIERGALTFLIEDMIIQKQGKKLKNSLERDAGLRVDQVLTQNKNIENAAKLIYGLTSADFRTLVLISQARRDIVAEELKSKNQDFFNWLSLQKKKATVHIFFLGFKWTGDRVE